MSFFCELMSPSASIFFVFVVIYKGMDAFVFLYYNVHFTLPKIVQAKLLITFGSNNIKSTELS
jgi:hypothetical protein